MANIKLQQHKFIVKSGMTVEDVKNSKDATVLQKKYASAFDTDGVKGFSQKEADIFNATTFSEKADGSVIFWTRQKDGNKKGIKFSSKEADKIQFKLEDNVKPYIKQVKVNKQQVGSKLNEKFDYSVDDGKISWTDKLKNLAKGMLSPITSLFESKENFLIGAGMIAGGAALIILSGGAAAPILVAAGATIGVVQLGAGVYKSNAAKTDAEVEQAWQGIGAGTSLLVLSALGAKGSLKASGVDVSEMNVTNATVECIKITPKAIDASELSIITKLGNILSDINNLINPGGGFMPQLAVAGFGNNKYNIQCNGSGALTFAPAIAAEDIVNSIQAGLNNINSTMACNGNSTQVAVDPSGGYSAKTGLNTPKRNINRTNYRKVGSESETVKQKSTQGPRRGKNKAESSQINVNHDVYEITDTNNGVTIKCWGQIDPKTGDLIITRLKEVTVILPNGEKFVSIFSKDITGYQGASAEKILNEFARAATGFCRNSSNESGIKSVYNYDKQGYPQLYDVNGNASKLVKFELKIYTGNETFDDSRFFATQQPIYKNKTWTMTWDHFEKQSPLHLNGRRDNRGFYKIIPSLP